MYYSIWSFQKRELSPPLSFVLFPSTGGFVSLRQIRYIHPLQTAEHSTFVDMSTCRRDAILWVCKGDIQGGQEILRRTEHTPTLPGLTSPVQGPIWDYKKCKAVQLTGNLVVPYRPEDRHNSSRGYLWFYALSRVENFSWDNLNCFVVVVVVTISVHGVQGDFYTGWNEHIFAWKGSSSSIALLMERLTQQQCSL